MEFQSYQPSQTLKQVVEEIGMDIDNVLKLDSGENQYVESIQEKKLTDMKFSVYPDPLCQSLREKLSTYTGLGTDQLMCGNGSDELIDLLIRIFISKEDEVIISPPTFPMYAFYAQLAEGKIISIVRNPDFSINVKKIIKAITSKTKLIFIDSPGNPTSVVTSLKDFELLLQNNVIVVSDEAYFEYCGKSVQVLLSKYPNLVILRTLSKWAGLAGLRIGYALGSSEMIRILLSIKAPYNVNSVAQKVAEDVLDKKVQFLQTIRELISYRPTFIQALFDFPDFVIYPSEGAYVLVRPKKTKAEEIQNYFKENGVLVKYINKPELINCLRINIPNQKDGKIIISLLRRFYETNSI